MIFCNKCFFFDKHQYRRLEQCFHESCFKIEIEPDEMIYRRISDFHIKNACNTCGNFKSTWKIFSMGLISVFEHFIEMKEERPKPPSPPPPPTKKEKPIDL